MATVYPSDIVLYVVNKNNPTIEDISLTGVPDLTNGVLKDERRGIRFLGTL